MQVSAVPTVLHCQRTTEGAAHLEVQATVLHQVFSDVANVLRQQLLEHNACGCNGAAGAVAQGNESPSTATEIEMHAGNAGVLLVVNAPVTKHCSELASKAAHVLVRKCTSFVKVDEQRLAMEGCLIPSAPQQSLYRHAAGCFLAKSQSS